MAKTLAAASGVLLVCAAGAFLLLDPRGAPKPAPAAELPAELREAMTAMQARVSELEGELAALRTRLELVEGQPAAKPKAADKTPKPGAEVAAPEAESLAEALAQPSPALEDALAAALERAEQRRREEKREANRDARSEKVLAWVDGEISRWTEQYELSEAQGDALRDLTLRTIEAQTQAKEDGASPWEFTQIEVGSQSEARRILGDRAYRGIQQDRMMGEARKSVTWVAMSVGGLSESQHAQLDEILNQRVTGKLEDTIRLRSEPMSEASHAELEQRMRAYDQESWNLIRNGVLTEAQRNRIPAK